MYTKKNLPNIVLITLDAFNFALFKKNLKELPNLNKIKEEGIFFEYAFSTGPMTPFSFPGIIGSLYAYPFKIGIRKNVETLDSFLSKIGYRTAFINESQAFLTPYFGYCKNVLHFVDFLELSHEIKDRKLKEHLLKKSSNINIKSFYLFDKIKSYFQNKPNSKIKKYLKLFDNFTKYVNLIIFKNYENIKERKILHDKFLNEIEFFIKKLFKEPQFLWIHTIVNHLPYLPPDDTNFSEKKINYLNYRGLSKLINKSVAKELKYLFIESMKTADNLIGIILNLLKNNEYLENSIIIVTTDHGEEFMEEGYFGHTSESSSDSLLRVPLIFYSKNIFKKRIITAPVSTIDILPTIIDLLNMNIPDTAQGITLKKLILNDNNENIKILKKLWKRPLYSDSWVYANLMDKTPGYLSNKKIFTVRYRNYKLKLIQNIKNNNTMIEQYDLIDWIKNKQIIITNNMFIFSQLKNLIYKHIYTQFSHYIKNMYINKG